MRDLRCLVGGVHRLSWIAVAFSSYDFISIRANRRPFLCGGAKAAEEFDGALCFSDKIERKWRRKGERKDVGVTPVDAGKEAARKSIVGSRGW